MYGIRYLRVFDYVSVSWYATGPARESEVYPRPPQIGGGKTSALISPIQPLPGLSTIRWIEKEENRGGDESNSRGRGRNDTSGTGYIEKKFKKFKKPEGERSMLESSRAQVPPWRTMC